MYNLCEPSEDNPHDVGPADSEEAPQQQMADS